MICKPIKFYQCHPILKMPWTWLIPTEQLEVSHRIGTVFQSRGLRGYSLEKLSFLKLPPSRLEGLKLSLVPDDPFVWLCLVLHDLATPQGWLSPFRNHMPRGRWIEVYFLFWIFSVYPLNSFFPNEMKFCFYQRTASIHMFKEEKIEQVCLQNPAPLCKSHPFLVSQLSLLDF